MTGPSGAVPGDRAPTRPRRARTVPGRLDHYGDLQPQEVLRWAIASARGQTLRDWEQVIVGDACTDDTVDVVAAFADPRLTFVNRAVNFGEQSGPNNEGLGHAGGSIVAYLNHDDLWFPDHLAELVRVLDETCADLVYALPLSIDRYGQPFCGVTNAELRYDPSHFVPACLLLVRRELLEESGGWRPAREIYAHNPSQDLLSRAWRQGRDLRCHPRITAVVLASGGRPRSYLLRDDSQHRQLWARMQEPDFRERLATAIVASLSRELHRCGMTRAERRNRLVDRALAMAGLHPNAVRNRLAGCYRGWRIDQLREDRCGAGPAFLGRSRLADRRRDRPHGQRARGRGTGSVHQPRSDRVPHAGGAGA